MIKISHVIVFLLLSSFLFAQQNQSSQSANASVNLKVPISISAMEGDLDFGEIIATGAELSKIIYPSSGKRFIVTGHPNSSVTILFSQIALSNTSPISGVTNTINFSPAVQSGSGKEIFSGSTGNLVPNGNVGELELFVGGTIAVAADQAQGDYNGTFTITVSY